MSKTESSYAQGSAPKVSVVMPAYNAMRFLPQTVASVLSQTRQDFELIVVDDGSSDGTDAFVWQQPDVRIRLVKQTNQGLAAARNAGIAASRGEYIALLDADDLWEPTKLEEQLARITNRPEVGLVHTAIRYINETGDEINRVLKVVGDGDVWTKVVVHNPVRCGSTPLIRRECFETVGMFDPALRFSEDWEMWIRIARRYHFATVDKPLTLYRQHGANMTKSYRTIMPNFETIIERAFQDAPAEHAALKREAYGRAYLFAAWRAFFAHDLQMAESLRKSALEAYPKLRFEKNSVSLTLRLMKAQWSGKTARER